MVVDRYVSIIEYSVDSRLIYQSNDEDIKMKSITVNKQSIRDNGGKCLVCETESVQDPFLPCTSCKDEYLTHGVMLVEVVGKGEHEKPTGRIMIIRDVAFEHVFNQTIPDGNVVKLEVGILQRMEDHINAEQ